ncbi:MAG: hypothetical protein WAV25_01455 [Minisyncoccia bacterium]
MVLSNPDQLDAFAQKPEEERVPTFVEPNALFDGIAQDMRRMAKEKRMPHDKALDVVLEDIRIQQGLSPREISDLREQFVDYDLKVLIQRSEESAEKKRRSHEDEHSQEVFVSDKPQVSTSGEHAVPANQPPREGWMDKWEREHDR